jgi:hypothetical protein
VTLVDSGLDRERGEVWLKGSGGIGETGAFWVLRPASLAQDDGNANARIEARAKARAKKERQEREQEQKVTAKEKTRTEGRGQKKPEACVSFRSKGRERGYWALM